MDITSANAKTFFDECVLEVSSYMKISIRIRDVVEITADDTRVRAIIQPGPHLFGLVSPAPESGPVL